MGAGLAATALVGCGDDDDDDDTDSNGGNPTAVPTATTAGDPTAAPTATAESTATATPEADIIKRGGHVNIRTGGVRSLDPHYDTWPACSATVGNVFNALLKFTPDFTEIVPDIATGMPEQPDDLTFVLKIRPDVTWQDIAPVSGRAFTAEDAKWSIERQMADDPKMKHDYFFQGAVESIDTPDNETLVFVGGYVTTGTQALSWGDPTTIALVAATRHVDESDPAATPLAAARSAGVGVLEGGGVRDRRQVGVLSYGRCAPGCGRPRIISRRSAREG